ncbi:MULTISPECIES: DNA primase [Xanthomonas]|uniref:DNA primase n=1 Tax=Xanthomonas rydalmerensis TaxID=3046274 RepID=A0ABZ0JQE3_9XANT|nr:MULTISPECIES: DNA primase [unclassified Xanthomonas]MBB5942423.1 nucleosome binding factor SPN SPT16 subunit [Xanthomonas sp. 3307]WOS41987.1 DNA primase [Xanthomonas sp. DM-2023]WOS46173.1 DNA primase [Xanthomonas sp. DM-2023]WOS50351.1 DNA primase [Xanthomonas sp. DM-2023]WOS54531.1 DNA primase [Xanthomonas sp. DM-2023]
MSETAFNLEWETLGNEGAMEAIVTQRARVFGGWLVRAGSGANAPLAFVPDPEGRWDGEDFGEDDYEYEEDEEGEEEEDEDEEGDDEDEDDVEDADPAHPAR